MISNRIAFKKIPPEGRVPYKDPHRRLHMKNLENLKKEIKAEKKRIIKEAEKDVMRDIQMHKKAVAEFNDRYRRLYII